jgi:hypothetical protein
MSQSLIRQQLGLTLRSSLKSLVSQSQTVMLLIDTSGSMSSHVLEPTHEQVMSGDYTRGKRKIEALREVVKDIQSQGDVPMIAFGGGMYDDGGAVRFVKDVPEPNGGTPLHLAIPFAKQYGANRIVVISDGMPDMVEGSMEAARAFGGRVDVVYIGAPGDPGEKFLKALANATGGVQLTDNMLDPKALASSVIGLLEGPKEPERAPLQGAGFSTVTPTDEEPEDDDDDEEDDDEEDDEEENDDADDK